MAIDRFFYHVPVNRNASRSFQCKQDVNLLVWNVSLWIPLVPLSSCIFFRSIADGTRFLDKVFRQVNATAQEVFDDFNQLFCLGFVSLKDRKCEILVIIKIQARKVAPAQFRFFSTDGELY